LRPADATRSLSELLRARGFIGTAPTFRRFVGKSYVEVVNLQATSGEVYVNLGAHHKWLGAPASWDAIKEYQCAFRARLADFAANQRFDLGDEASVTALLEMMKLEGSMFFSAVGPENLEATARRLAKEGYRAFIPLDAPAGPDTWAKVAAHFHDERSKKRFLAQQAGDERARAKERERESAEAVVMTWDEYRKAKKEGRAPKVVQLVFDSKPKKRRAR
jgi:hypothetical protein